MIISNQIKSGLKFEDKLNDYISINTNNGLEAKSSVITRHSDFNFTDIFICSWKLLINNFLISFTFLTIFLFCLS